VADLYWRTALWVAILTFPIFAATFAIAEPLTVLLYEERYAGSATFLALLSLGYYFNAALGFNGLTLKVFGRLRYIVVINLVAAGVSIVANLLLIAPLGAMGAAIGTFLALLVHNILKQAGLPANTGIALFDRRHARAYGFVAAAAGGLLVVQLALDPPPAVSVALALGTSAVVLLANRRALQLGATFPELNRVPILRRLIAE
jgi:O-antigen/teichoic acid export membrane protein